MLFMVIEHFDQAKLKDVYRHLRDRGRGVPDGVRYVDSWIEASFGRCFQLMECDDATLLQEWVLHWSALARFEIVPVAPSKQVSAMIEKHL
jgi:hypothetical protein